MQPEKDRPSPSRHRREPGEEIARSRRAHRGSTAEDSSPSAVEQPGSRLLVLGLAVLALGVVLFLIMTGLTAAGATRTLDERVMLWFSERSSPRLDGAALEFTALGSAYVAAIVAIVASAFVWEHGYRRYATLIWIGLGGGWLLARIAKGITDRPRPEVFDWRTPYAGEASYPSGHTTTATVVYATLLYLVFRLESTRALRAAIAAVFIVVILLVGVSRVYLGVHYPSDVIGGFLMGLSWAVASALSVEGYVRLRARRDQSSAGRPMSAGDSVTRSSADRRPGAGEL